MALSWQAPQPLSAEGPFGATRAIGGQAILKDSGSFKDCLALSHLTEDRHLEESEGGAQHALNNPSGSLQLTQPCRTSL